MSIGDITFSREFCCESRDPAARSADTVWLYVLMTAFSFSPDERARAR
jgi:hypothetical protein